MKTEDEKIKKFNDNLDEITKGMTDVWKNATLNEVRSKYTSCIKKVVRNKRDEKLSEKIFDIDGVKVSDIIEIVDKYEKIEKNLIEHFNKSVTVKFKDPAKFERLKARPTRLRIFCKPQNRR